MSATGIVFLALSVVMLGLGFYGASVDVVSATGLAESIGQMKNFYFLLGGLILSIVLYRLAFSHFFDTLGQKRLLAAFAVFHPFYASIPV